MKCTFLEERLKQLVHNTGTDFTGGNQSCPTCRKMYNRLANDQGWAKFPDEQSEELVLDPKNE